MPTIGSIGWVPRCSTRLPLERRLNRWPGISVLAPAAARRVSRIARRLVEWGCSISGRVAYRAAPPGGFGADRSSGAKGTGERASDADHDAPGENVEVGPRASRPSSSRLNGLSVTLQDLILKLSAFWASHGCLLQQPLDLEVGAGTSHPETLFRVLGPKPWSVAYVQPSRRPDDGRFGQNPNRLFKHHQYQVILKPSPDEVQQLYLDSLESCGINPRQHDIRFEEDNWESPTLGAWGIGWQVLLDGLEITQFTYFQQVGGMDLAPISCEITYGSSASRCSSSAWTTSSTWSGAAA